MWTKHTEHVWWEHLFSVIKNTDRKMMNRSVLMSSLSKKTLKAQDLVAPSGKSAYCKRMIACLFLTYSSVPMAMLPY